jgi:hypothetical protein
MRLFGPSPGSSLGAQSTATLTITDNDSVSSLQFSMPRYTARESGGSATITVKRVGNTANQVAMDFATSDGTATAGKDYTQTSGSLTFSPGVITRTFSVPIAEDAIGEPGETINLALSNPQPPTGAALGSLKTATITIVDNDQRLQFGAASYTVAETTPRAVITVKRIGGTSGTVYVDYAATGGTATNGTDYVLSSGTLTFGPGQAIKTFMVSIQNDTNVEGSETAQLTLSNARNATVVGANPALLTILDNEPTFQFAAAAYKVSELTPKATITVKRTGSLAAQATVDYALTGGTATNGVDYTLASPGTLTFGPGVAIKTISIPIAKDNVDEPAEIVLLALGNPTPVASIALGTPSVTTLTITDNDTAGKVQFSAANYSVDEGGRSATITVTRSGGTSGGAMVDYAVVGGTATNDESDCYLAPGTLTFGPGEMTKTITIPITHDNLPETNETVILALTANPSGGLLLGAQTTATLWIVE